MSISLITSPNDQKKYRFIELENGLRVTLISDETAIKSAAALAIQVGHFDDPKGREGMAHFLEHMLFLGTEGYPKAGEYQQFISENGGTQNAWTGPELTSYFFDIAPDVFEEALDRFSQFFISPLFDAHLIDKERQSVDSEFKMKLRDDPRRFYQVHKETVNPNHPFAKFSVGNQHTLACDEESSIREDLLKFYAQNYCAGLMTLVVVSADGLNVIEELVRTRFGQVKNRGAIKQHRDEPLYLADHLNVEIQIVPLKKQRQLSLTFALPAMEQWYRSKPLTYLSSIIGFEGKGSLMSTLRDEGLISQLSAGGGINGYNFKDYNVSFQLTDKGIEQQDRILALTFRYIEMIQSAGLEHWRYLERKQLLDRAFRFQEQNKPLDFASHLAINMQHYAVEDIIFGDYRMDGIEPEVMEEILGYFHPENIRLTLIHAEAKTNQTAKWYDTPYQIKSISQQRRETWQNDPLFDKLSLPKPNPFLANLMEHRDSESVATTPSCVGESTQLKLWYKKDRLFNVPKAHVFLALDSPNCHSTSKQAAMTRLYISLLLDSLSEHTYQAEVAGLNYNIYPHQGGLTLHLNGFTGGQEALLQQLLLNARKRQFAEARFIEIKNQMLRNWNGIRTTRPISRLFNALTTTIQKSSHEPLKMAAALEDCSLDQLHEHIDDIYQQINVEGMIYGDWLQDEAERLHKRLTRTLQRVTQPGPEVKRQLISIRNKGTMLREIDHDHQDSAIIVYYQAPANKTRKMALFSLLNHAMNSNFFNELRTKQQLGYVVGTSYVPMNRCPGMILFVQSPVAGPLQLLEAIDQFVADFGYALMQISDTQWQATKKALCDQLLEQDSNQKARARRFWGSIGNKDTSFDHRERLADAIQKIERADLLKYIMTKMRLSNPDRLVLFSNGHAHQTHEPLSGEQQITDLTHFKRHADIIDF